MGFTVYRNLNSFKGKSITNFIFQFPYLVKWFLIRRSADMVPPTSLTKLEKFE